MFGFGNHEDAHNQVYGGQTHHSEWSHELIAGAAAFEAMKSVERGRPEDKHKLTRELFAAMAGAEADKLFESKGLDFLDRERASMQAKEQAGKLFDQNYQ
ncbi:hypothetical protein BGZ97_011434 [Linnemannia gamsii]|jgi:hypothetical protein|uniref:CipC-like antibiotic response protein n=1 Tax=Linnemannia gamsii TaxID=64522 RepID=A0A9P6UN84_9FUNG|nr:hypothetical protein BGZ97_011434 [Linnemannia gamsii]